MLWSYQKLVSWNCELSYLVIKKLLEKNRKMDLSPPSSPPIAPTTLVTVATNSTSITDKRGASGMSEMEGECVWGMGYLGEWRRRRRRRIRMIRRKRWMIQGGWDKEDETIEKEDGAGGQLRQIWETVSNKGVILFIQIHSHYAPWCISPTSFFILRSNGSSNLQRRES